MGAGRGPQANHANTRQLSDLAKQHRRKAGVGIRLLRRVVDAADPQAVQPDGTRLQGQSISQPPVHSSPAVISTKSSTRVAADLRASSGLRSAAQILLRITRGPREISPEALISWGFQKRK